MYILPLHIVGGIYFGRIPLWPHRFN